MPRQEADFVPLMRKTVWRNPTEETVKAVFGHGEGPRGRPLFRIEVGPGEEIELDAKYDAAVPRLAPHLVRADGAVDAPAPGRDAEPLPAVPTRGGRRREASSSTTP